MCETACGRPYPLPAVFVRAFDRDLSWHVGERAKSTAGLVGITHEIPGALVSFARSGKTFPYQVGSKHRASLPLINGRRDRYIPGLAEGLHVGAQSTLALPVKTRK
jgi:hypothetical protein